MELVDTPDLGSGALGVGVRVPQGVPNFILFLGQGGIWLSLVERLDGVQEVAGSNPVIPTSLKGPVV